MEDHLIFGVHITDRLVHAGEVQKVLTEYGNHIKTRLGLHEVEKGGSPNGVLILEMVGDQSRCNEMSDKLNAIEGVEVKQILFEH